MDAGDGTWPLTYVECRERFRRASMAAAAAMSAHPIAARGPAGEELTIDVAVLGSATPRRALFVPSGIHGVEGYAGSMIQCELLRRLAVAPPEWGDTALLLVHAVNPWGMAWWRRANESNVDLNRNWQDFDGADLPTNDAYPDVHHLLCPAGDDLPGADEFLAGLSALSEQRGLAWVREAVSGGQYTHPDGLYFGGARREESTRIIEAIAVEHLEGAEAVLAVDLHTGHGPAGTYTLLSHRAEGSPADRWLRERFDGDRIEVTLGNPDATSAPKLGQIVPGVLERLGSKRSWKITFELGTRSETRMIVVERAEHWVHRFGDRRVAAHAAAVWDHRTGSMLDDAAWERSAIAHGRTVLDQAMAALPSL